MSHPCSQETHYCSRTCPCPIFFQFLTDEGCGRSRDCYRLRMRSIGPAELPIHRQYRRLAVVTTRVIGNGLREFCLSETADEVRRLVEIQSGICNHTPL